MTPRISLSLIALSDALVPFLWLKTSDIILISVLGSIGIVLMWSIIHSFIVTTMPTPTLPMLVNSSLTLGKLFKNYLEVMILIGKSVNVAVG
ncbi:MAG: hypothetical protein KA714_09225 [Limnoraphis sp. WC205]|jgi:hypothetical protein|nr:hypothetical protein [Limnoraphis sp. WC205]